MYHGVPGYVQRSVEVGYVLAKKLGRLWALELGRTVPSRLIPPLPAHALAPTLTCTHLARPSLNRMHG